MNFVEAPQIQSEDFVVELLQIQSVEVVVELPQIQSDDVFVEPPIQFQKLEKILEPPQIQSEDVAVSFVEVPQIQSENVVELPQIQFENVVVEAPIQIQKLDKIVELPPIQFEDVVLDVPIQIQKVEKLRRKGRRRQAGATTEHPCDAAVEKGGSPDCSPRRQHERTYKGLTKEQLHVVFMFLRSIDFDPSEVVQCSTKEGLQLLLQSAYETDVCSIDRALRTHQWWRN